MTIFDAYGRLRDATDLHAWWPVRADDAEPSGMEPHVEFAYLVVGRERDVLWRFDDPRIHECSG
jgi:hypothetical protein